MVPELGCSMSNDMIKRLPQQGKTLTPFIKLRRPSKFHLAVGACPRCGRLDNWLNNVPLTAYCNGSEEQPHREWKKVVPNPYNIYLGGYDSNAIPPPIAYEDRRPQHLRED